MAVDIRKILEHLRTTKSFKTFSVGKCKLTVYSDGKLFGLQGVRLESRDRGRGEATKALTALMQALDELHATIRLQVQPMDKKTDKEGLIRLYSRFGFRQIPDSKHTGYFMMERKPQKKKVNAMSIESLSRKLATAGIKHVVVSGHGKHVATANNEEDEKHFKTIIAHAKEIESIEVTRINGNMAIIVHMKSGVKHTTPFGNIFMLRKALADKHLKGVDIDWEGLYRKAAGHVTGSDLT